MPSIVSRLMEKSPIHITKNDATSDTGMAITGIKVALQFRRNTKMITITRAKAIASVSTTSVMAALMNVEAS